MGFCNFQSSLPTLFIFNKYLRLKQLLDTCELRQKVCFYYTARIHWSCKWTFPTLQIVFTHSWRVLPPPSCWSSYWGQRQSPVYYQFQTEPQSLRLRHQARIPPFSLRFQHIRFQIKRPKQHPRYNTWSSSIIVM